MQVLVGVGAEASQSEILLMDLLQVITIVAGAWVVLGLLLVIRDCS